MFAVGSDDNVTYTGKVQIFEYNENTRCTQLVHCSCSSYGSQLSNYVLQKVEVVLNMSSFRVLFFLQKVRKS